MGSVIPKKEQLAAFMDLDLGDSAVVMLNLLRFREQAEYPSSFEAEPCSGREAYRRYSEHALAALAEVGGKITWVGEALISVIAPEGERWDEVALVEYPSKQAFMQLAMTVESNRSAVHRTAALSDSRLIAMEAVDIPATTQE
ncbi:MAG: DUF1330 domain-containing protein [Deltaproteobacteria bacterium]